jgi:ferric-dicitrate binding protein FerR (iron transport regulator)
MGNELYNTLEDLVFSRSFRNWVLKGNAPEADFWMDWLARNPDKQEVVNQAKAIIYALQLNLRPLPEEVVEREIVQVLEKLHEGRFGLSRELPLRPIATRRTIRVWTIAAVVAGIAIFAWSLRQYWNRGREDVLQSFLTGHQTAPIVQRKRDTDTTGVLTLPDGSTVRLTRGSRLYYPDKLLTAGHRREVYLDGGASFDIAHNATYPFYVYTHSIVTKVLGTSFRIASGTGTRTVITVASGKISVYRNTDLADGVILTPNQRITYDPTEDRLDRSIADEPQQLTRAADTSLVFNATPLATVFHRLQTLYGITILYDEESISGCSLSVTMGNEPFYEKLNIICKAIGATYESIDGQIVVTTRGCK